MAIEIRFSDGKFFTPSGFYCEAFSGKTDLSVYVAEAQTIRDLLLAGF